MILPPESGWCASITSIHIEPRHKWRRPSNDLTQKKRRNKPYTGGDLAGNKGKRASASIEKSSVSTQTYRMPGRKDRQLLSEVTLFEYLKYKPVHKRAIFPACFWMRHWGNRWWVQSNTLPKQCTSGLVCCCAVVILRMLSSFRQYWLNNNGINLLVWRAYLYRILSVHHAAWSWIRYNRCSHCSRLHTGYLHCAVCQPLRLVCCLVFIKVSIKKSSLVHSGSNVQ